MSSQPGRAPGHCAPKEAGAWSLASFPTRPQFPRLQKRKIPNCLPGAGQRGRDEVRSVCWYTVGAQSMLVGLSGIESACLLCLSDPPRSCPSKKRGRSFSQCPRNQSLSLILEPKRYPQKITVGAASSDSHNPVAWSLPTRNSHLDITEGASETCSLWDCSVWEKPAAVL